MIAARLWTLSSIVIINLRVRLFLVWNRNSVSLIRVPTPTLVVAGAVVMTIIPEVATLVVVMVVAVVQVDSVPAVVVSMIAMRALPVMPGLVVIRTTTVADLASQMAVVMNARVASMTALRVPVMTVLHPVEISVHAATTVRLPVATSVPVNQLLASLHLPSPVTVAKSLCRVTQKNGLLKLIVKPV